MIASLKINMDNSASSLNNGATPNKGAAPNNGEPSPKHGFQRIARSLNLTSRDMEAGKKARMRWIVFGIIVLGIVNAPTLMTTSVGERGMLAVAIGGLLFMLLVKSPRDGVVLTLLYLGIMGGLRRSLIPVFGWIPQDPLVLVEAAVAGGCFFFLFISRRLYNDTRLARCISILLGIMTLEIVNPLQGGIAVGIAGALFMMVPLFWYYLGRRLGTPLIVLQLIRAALILSIFGALYGLYQTWFGYQPSELLWKQVAQVTDERPFSFFTTVAEYGIFLSIGIAILWAAYLKGNRAALVVLPLLLIAILFLSERGVVLIALFVGTALWAVQGRNRRVWLPRALLAAVVASIGLVFTLTQAQQVTFSGSTQQLVQHQTSGILNPGSSSAPLHGQLVVTALIEGVTSPLGHGIGTTTEASRKFGKGINSSEIDWSDTFVSFGFIGGLLYLYMIFRIFQMAVREWNRTRSFVSLVTLGILLATFTHWLHGGYYAVTMLVWFLIGALDRSAHLAQLAPEVYGNLNGKRNAPFDPEIIAV